MIDTALFHAARLMRQQLHERGEERIDVDTEIERLAEPGIEPRRARLRSRSPVRCPGAGDTVRRSSTLARRRS
jgi:hypothetical protein